MSAEARDVSAVVEVEVTSGGIVHFAGRKLKSSTAFHEGTVKRNGVKLIYREKSTSYKSILLLPARGKRIKVRISNKNWEKA